ncbi:MAG: YsnF/AvaK domain-containing protein [Goleter apudmare HA4340-LM2]|jgi:hypothetical protein|nr:YsnF/AvaK domain-containing protein [Goleter apudmare HA4340-LM2]
MPEDLKTANPGGQTISPHSTEQTINSQIINTSTEVRNLEESEEDRIIKLLEERLVVKSNQQKLGDVIVRKVIETLIVEVPVRREKLIVEQVSPENKQLAEIDLGSEEISGIELMQGERPEFLSLDGRLTVSGEFSSPKIASLLLNAIALEKNHGCSQVQVTIFVEDQQRQQKYQEWFDRCSKGQKPT